MAATAARYRGARNRNLDNLAENTPLLSRRGSQNVTDPTQWLPDLINYTDLPEWAKDNEYILRYYRPITNSWSHVFRSTFFQLHNETFNIFSHLLPSLITLYLSFYTIFNSKYESVTEKLVFICLYSCATVMMLCSATFHSTLCHSYRSFCFFSKLDYSGIAFMVMGSFIPWTFYVFYENRTLRIAYSAGMAGLCIFCVTTSFIEKFASPEYRGFRAMMFICLGLSTVIPVLHSAVIQGRKSVTHISSRTPRDTRDPLESSNSGTILLESTNVDPESQYIHNSTFLHCFWQGLIIIWNEYYLWALLIMGFLYIFGATLYALRFPEKLWPGKFDLFFNSHNLHHVFIVLGASLHFLVINWLHLKNVESRR